jgi:hypothetical protein
MSDGRVESFLTFPATPATEPPIGVTPTTATIAGSLNPGGHDTHWQFEYGPTAEYGFASPAMPADGGSSTADLEVSTILTGLQPLTTYRYRLSATNAGGSSLGPEREFTTPPTPPVVVTGSPESVSADTATLTGSVNPESALTTYRFEYGTNTAYGSVVPVSEGEAGSFSTPRYVSVSIDGLEPDTEYHYRLLATNSGGTGLGEDGTFTTNATGEPNLSPISPAFSLTGTAPSTPAALVYPNLPGLTPATTAKTTTTKVKPLTRAQKLTRALDACKKDISHKQRQMCVKQAKKKYAPAVKKK